jgi:hypothetical protein
MTDELELVRRFRDEVPDRDGAAWAVARSALTSALTAPAENPSPRRRPRRVRAWRWRPFALFAVLAVVGATGALAATGLLVGSPVRPAAPLSPVVGEGIPAAGGSRLLAARVADPGGGPPWGVRIVHTTRGFVCLQIGRVENGQLGELGIDGAFHDDGQFHPLPADVLPNPAAGVSFDQNSICEIAGRTFSVLAFGVDRNAASLARGIAASPPYQREISYGLLGTHAVSVTYTTGHGRRTTPVDPGTGVFLLVQRRPHPQLPGTGLMVAEGSGQRKAEHPGPNGVLIAVTYRFGSLVCSDSRDPQTARSCPRPSRPTPGQRVNLHEPLHVSLDIKHGLIFGAELRFTAPYAVTSGREQYETELHVAACRNHSAIVGLTPPVGRNLVRGSTVQVSLPYVFINSCTRSATITVVFYGPGTTTSTQIGSIAIREPRGTQSAQPPIPRHYPR